MTKSTKLTKITAIVLAFIMLFSVNVFAEEIPSSKEQTSVANAVLTYADMYYHFGVDNKALLENFITLYLEENPDGFERVMDVIMDSLDEHSVYFTKEEFDAFNNYLEAEFAGIGAYLARESGYIVISGVMDDSPAQKAALQTGDKILSANGYDLRDTDTEYAVSRIRGEIGTEVTLKILRDGVGEFEVTLIRDTIKDQTVASAVLENQTGYIYITNFSTTTSEEFEKELNIFDDLSIKKIIIDVRGNVGGVTEEALDCLSLLLPKDDKLLVVKSRGAEDDVYYNTFENAKKRSIVVLTDGGSASAAEIFAAGIKDNEAGTLIGEKTYGKGTMQNVISLGNYGGIKITVAEFTGPLGTPINKVGIAPDIRVANKKREVTKEDTVQFTFERIYKKGDESEQVLAIKQKLALLNYFDGTMDNYYDESLHQAVKTFQEVNGLYPYGVTDITTQTYINNLMDGVMVTEDTQLETAIEFLKGAK